MVGMSDEEAKAAQEIAKAASKGIGAAEKAGGFFARVFGQPIEDTVGAYWGDPIRARRIERGIELSQRVEKRLMDAGVSEIRPILDKIGVPLLENATLEDDANIQGMYANFLFNAINPASDEVDIQYVKTIESFTAGDFLLFEAIFNGMLPAPEPLSLPSQHDGAGTPVEKMLRRSAMLSIEGVTEKNILHLRELGLLKPATVWVEFGLSAAMATPISRDPFDFELTEYAKDFAKVVRE